MSFVSIIIPCYNDAIYVRRAVLSAKNQTYKDKEIIVVDDGSNSPTKEVLRNLSQSIDKLIVQENKGLSAARNAGIKASQGDLIVVLDSDDFFAPEFCQKAVYIKKNLDYKIITCYANLFDSSGVLSLYKPRGGTIKNFLFSNSAIGNSLFSKEDWEKIGGYDENMTKGFEDWEFYIRLLKDSGEAYVIKEPLFNYRQKKTSMRKEANAIKYELWRYIFLKHNKLYIEYYNEFVNFFLEKIQQEEAEKIKNLERKEFLIGQALLKPIRYLKSKLS
ncbi:glycosyltransferase family 2 protein [Leeuwenhoekiella sp. A2]|uniref:glycosyltransferase family 2 protein n=1 Tax=Leeuwenhoekiella sp. A2 TaxID=3141460 RepID=UPI003A8068E6